jgi:hypothetical protein
MRYFLLIIALPFVLACQQWSCQTIQQGQQNCICIVPDPPPPWQPNPYIRTAPPGNPPPGVGGCIPGLPPPPGVWAC